jgi:hypothetical protein
MRMFNSSVPFLRSAVPKDSLNLRLDFVKFGIYYQHSICIFVGKRRKFGYGHKLTRINRHNRFRICLLQLSRQKQSVRLLIKSWGGGGGYVCGLSPTFGIFYSLHVKTKFMIFHRPYCGDEGGNLKKSVQTLSLRFPPFSADCT